MERTVIRDSGGPDRDSYPEISRPKQRSNLILQDAQLLHCCFILGISFASQDNRYWIHLKANFVEKWDQIPVTEGQKAMYSKS